MSRPQRVPPSPEVMRILYMRYLDHIGQPGSPEQPGAPITFTQWLELIGFTDHARKRRGMDDGVRKALAPNGIGFIDVPQKPVRDTTVFLKVLLVDFEDRPANLPAEHFENLFFSKGIHPTGSLNDFYQEVTLNSVKISGSIHGWIRMPHNYAYYTNNSSGTGNTYPRNAQGMAEDAVKAAIDQKIPFPKELDVLDEGVVTALLIVHSGTGAEKIPPGPAQSAEIWSHKWVLPNPVSLDPATRMVASTYLTVPHDCKLGVCAHELGHLAFQWQDFYVFDFERIHSNRDVSGDWDLMSGGCYNGAEDYPAHPAGLHKLQHGWVTQTVIDFSKSQKASTIDIAPYNSQKPDIAILRSPVFSPKQFLLLENRLRFGFDRGLPGEGLVVWRIDEDGSMQVSGRAGNISTSFDGQESSGITLSDIKVDALTKFITLTVSYTPVKSSPASERKMSNDSVADLVKSAVLAAAGDADTRPGRLPDDTPLANKIGELAQYAVLTAYINGIIKHYNSSASLKRTDIEALTSVADLIALVEQTIKKVDHA